MMNWKLSFVFAAAFVFGTGLTTMSAQHDHVGHEDKAKEHVEEAAGHSHGKAQAHGGVATMSKEFHVETVFMPDQVRLYLYDGKQNPMHVKHWKKGLVEATGIVQFRDSSRGAVNLEFEHATPAIYDCLMCSGQQSDKSGKCTMCGMTLVQQGVPQGTLWSCPMHPDENSKSPGKCSDCGMKYKPQDYLVAEVDFKGLKAGDAKINLNLKNLPGEKEQTLQFTEKFTPLEMQGKHDEDKLKEGGHDKPEHGGHDHGGH